MIKRTLIDPEEKVITIAEVKAAMGFSRTDKDDELEKILRSAISQVEEVGDVSLRGYNVSLNYDFPNAVNELYLHPVLDITSVKSEQGEDIDYTLHYDKRRFTLDKPQSCVVECQTQALNKEQQSPYINAIIRLCMWEFNKSDDYKERIAILNSIRA